jgi:hypothetical protein
MKLFAGCVALGLILSLPGSAPAKSKIKDRKSPQKVERSTTVTPQVTLTLCVSSGTINVRGWDKNEIRATSGDADDIQFRRIDKTKDPSSPANRIDVMILQKSAGDNHLDCQALADVDMDVPANATVQVQTRDGDIRISGVAAAYAGSQNGDITIERATKLVEAGSVGGSISLRDSAGRVTLNSAGGGVDVVNVKPGTSDDSIDVGTVSGDILLERVSNSKVTTKTVNGNVTMIGPLTSDGSYVFTLMGGDLTLKMPKDASFKLSAKVSERRDIVSEFPLKFLSDSAAPPTGPTPESVPEPEPAPEPGSTAPQAAPKTVPPKPNPKTPPPAPAEKAEPPSKTVTVITPVIVAKPVISSPYILHRFNAICGSGDATILVSSFGGSLLLKKL